MVSVNEALVRSWVLEFVRVSVTVLVAPDWIVEGLKDLVIVGGASVTVRLTGVLGNPAPASFVLKLVAVFEFWPTLRLVTTTVTVQLLLAGMAMPLKASKVAPLVSVFGLVPVQAPVPVGNVWSPLIDILDSWSVNCAPVKGMTSGLVNVKVIVLVLPAGIEVGLNALLIVAGTTTYSVSLAGDEFDTAP